MFRLPDIFLYFGDRYSDVPTPYLNAMEEMEHTPMLNGNLVAANKLVRYPQNYQILVLDKENLSKEIEVYKFLSIVYCFMIQTVYNILSFYNRFMFTILRGTFSIRMNLILIVIELL